MSQHLTSLRCESGDGVCVFVREEIRALKDLRSLCVELLIDHPNIICLLISIYIVYIQVDSLACLIFTDVH